MKSLRAIAFASLCSVAWSCCSSDPFGTIALRDQVQVLCEGVDHLDLHVGELDRHVVRLDESIGTPALDDTRTEPTGLLAELRASTAATARNAAATAAADATIQANTQAVSGVGTELMSGWAGVLPSAFAFLTIIWTAVGMANTARARAETVWVESERIENLPALRRRLRAMTAFSVRDLVDCYRYCFFALELSLIIAALALEGVALKGSIGLLVVGMLIILKLDRDDRAAVIGGLDGWPLQDGDRTRRALAMACPLVCQTCIDERWVAG